MDIEKQRRAELIELLGASFYCREEVRLSHAAITKAQIRADVIASAKEGPYAGVPLAFEVKEPSASWQSKDWIYSLRQAADYVYAKVEPQSLGVLGCIAGRRVVAAFVYPSPPIRDFGLDDGTDPLLGAVTMALHFRVGQARQSRGRPQHFALAFSNTEIWRSDSGFKSTADQFLDGRYRLGSRQINILHELDNGEIVTSIEADGTKGSAAEARR